MNIVSEESGFTLIELVIVLIILIILVSSVSAYFSSLQNQIDTSACKANQMGLIQAQNIYYTDCYMNDGQGKYAEELEDLVPYLKNERTPECPAQGSYLLLENGDVRCTIPRHKRIN